MASTSDITNALKYRYGADEVAYLFNEESVVWNILAKRKLGMGGRGQHIIPILTQNPTAFTGITEGGSLPTPLQPATAEASFALQEYVGMYNVSWKLIQDARNDEFSFERAVALLDDGLKRHVMRMLNADLLSDGRGILGKFPAADDQATITLDRPSLASLGMVVDCMDTDNDTVHGNSLTVTANDPVNKTLTLSGSVSSTAAGDYIVIQDTCDDSQSDSLHSNGLLSVIETANPASVVGNYGGINRSTAGNEYWESALIGNSGTNRPLEEDLLIQGGDNARIIGGGKIDSWISNQAIVRRYYEQMAGERFFSMSPTQNMSGGLGPKGQGKRPSDDGKTIYNFGGIPWHVDPYFEPNTILGLDKSHLWIGHGENEAPRPISEIFDNIPFFRQTTSATFEVAWYYQMELLCDAPNTQVRVNDIAES
jgi:hypothetical protein